MNGGGREMDTLCSACRYLASHPDLIVLTDNLDWLPPYLSNEDDPLQYECADCDATWFFDFNGWRLQPAETESYRALPAESVASITCR